MTARLGLLGFGLLASALLVAPALPAAEGSRRIVLAEGVDYFGGDFKDLRNVSLEDCQAACLAEARCQAFTYNRKAGSCFLKANVSEPRSFAAAVSGSVVTGTAAPMDPVARRQAELSILPATWRDEAAELDRRLRAGAALAKGTDAGVAAALEAVRDAPADHGRWLRAAEAALAVDTNDWARQQRARTDATAAAINAYLTAESVRSRAGALKLIARALEGRSAWRPAIRANRAALTLVDDPALAAHLEQLVATHGFRVTEHKVDADARDPRICVAFSDPGARWHQHRRFH